MSADDHYIPELPQAGEPHYDGIGEEDNPIPPWWWWTFFATILFAAFYIPYYMLTGWSQVSQYTQQVEQAQAVAKAAAPANSDTNPFHGNTAAIADGKQVFTTICAACHKPDGSGLVGPSLIDPYWKYGNQDHDLFLTVAKGRPGGMPAWESQLGTDKIWKALAYVETLPKSAQPGVGAPGFVPPAATAPAPAPSPAPGP
jgi:cytochrome c oxidase cbb3-type subunit III